MKAILIMFVFCFASNLSWAAEDLSEGEYFWDVDPGYGKATKILIPKSSSSELLLDISTINLSYGTHQLGVRVKSAQNMWSSTLIETVFVHTPLPLGDHTQLTEIEYFFENDLGYGKNKILELSPKTNLNYENIEIPIPAELKIGTSSLYYRIKTGRGQWSSTLSAPIAVLDNNPNRGIAKVELFLYVNDPGLDKAINLPITPTNGKEVTVDYSLPVKFEGPGYSYYNFRAKDTEGRWSALYTSRFDVSAILGIEESQILSIYPNPAADFFTVDLSEKDCKIELYNSVGKLLKRFSSVPVNNQYQISELPSGLYFLKVSKFSDNKLIGAYKLIKN